MENTTNEKIRFTVTEEIHNESSSSQNRYNTNQKRLDGRYGSRTPALVKRKSDHLRFLLISLFQKHLQQ